eukprot:4815870-Pyramimonas_sp.AAC.1
MGRRASAALSGQTCISSAAAHDLRPTRREHRSMPISLSSAGSRRNKPGTGMRTSEWLIAQIEMMMLREKEEWNIDLHEGTVNQRARQMRLGGGGGNGNGNRRGLHGKAAAAEAAARLGKSTDAMK